MSALLRYFLLLGCVLAFTNAGKYDGYKLYEAVPKTLEQCELLRTLSNNEAYDFFSLRRLPELPARVMVSPEEQPGFVAILQQNALNYQVINDNVGATLERDFQLNRQLRNANTQFSGKGRLSTERYYTHGEINAYIEDMAARYPARVFVKTVGRSYEGRIMKTITITNGDGRSNKQVVLMDGGFHAREWISPAAVLYAIEQLVEHYSDNAALLLDYDWVILPVVNPDGYEFTQLSPDARVWRKTRQPNVNEAGEICIGTDPNRNFDFHWNEEGASSDPCSNTFAGPHPFSEPEAVVVRDLIHTHRGRGVMYLTVHTYGNLLLYPWGWTSDLPDTWEDLHEVTQAGGDAVFEATGTVYKVGSSTNVLYIAAGASDDYAFYYDYPISVTMELAAGGNDGFDPPPSYIDPYVKEAWIGIRGMAQKLVVKYPLD